MKYFKFTIEGSGKTYTMTGFDSKEEMGLIPRISYDIFDWMDSKKKKGEDFQENDSNTSSDCLLKLSFIEIYNEKVRNLFF